MTQPTGLRSSSQIDLFQAESSTDEASETSTRATSEGSPIATSSPGSAGGPMPPSLLAGLPIDPSGLDPALVSLSRTRDGAKVATIHGICGPTSFASSAPSGPLQSWENRLRERLARIGSTESALIWETHDTPAGRSISRLRPWTPRRSASGFTGSHWPTEKSATAGPDFAKADRSSTGLSLQTVIAQNDKAVWPAVQASTASSGSTSRSGDRKDELLLLGMMRENSDTAPRSTPRATDGEKGSANQQFGDGGGQPLPAQMAQAMWAVPRAGDFRSGSSQKSHAELRDGSPMLPEQMHATAAGGPAPSGSSATTKKRGGSPNPAFPCWLQGFPADWLRGAALATRSIRSSPRKSSSR